LRVGLTQACTVNCEMKVDSFQDPVSKRCLARLARRILGATLLVGLLAGGGWYANAHYRLPKQHLAEAEQALDERDFARARTHLEQCLDARPNDPRAHFLMARTARRAGALDVAEKHLTLCEHLQNDRPNPSLGDTRLEWALIQAQRGKLAEVDSYLRRYLREQHPDDHLILETMSWELMGRNRLDEALLLLDIWLKKQPGEYEALVRRGWVHEHLFHREGAIDDYRAALEIRPERDNVRQRLVEMLLNSNLIVDALSEAEELYRRRPEDPEAQVCYARCLRTQGQSEDAVRVLERVLADHPKHAVALALRAQIAYGSGQFEEARGLMERALAVDPTNRQLMYTLFLCLTKLNRPQELKELEARMKKMEADLARMNKLVRSASVKPNDPTTRYEAGVIFLQYGMTQDGLHWLSTALEADPNHGPTHQALADYYEKTGDTELAIRALARGK
jgi:tetratricopeptide (TPR) repeat protein